MTKRLWGLLEGRKDDVDGGEVKVADVVANVEADVKSTRVSLDGNAIVEDGKGGGD